MCVYGNIRMYLLNLASPELWIALMRVVGHPASCFQWNRRVELQEASGGLLLLLPVVKGYNTFLPLPFPPQHIQNKTHTTTSPSMHILDFKKLRVGAPAFSARGYLTSQFTIRWRHDIIKIPTLSAIQWLAQKNRVYHFYVGT